METYREPPSLDTHEYQEDYRGDEHVQPEERADSVGEELAYQQPERQAFLHDPRDKLRVGDCGAENAKEQIDIFAIHRILSNS